MSAVLKDNRISVEEYLAGELISEVKHEYEDGYVYAMSGTSKNHDKIVINLLAKFINQLSNMPCDVYSNVKAHVSKTKFYYPDVMVVCGDKTDNEYFTESPILIVEVLSKSTRRKDHTTKRFAYRQIETLQEYVLIEQDTVHIEISRRTMAWDSAHYFLGDEVDFASVDLKVSVAEIYRRVANEDMQEFLQAVEKQAQLSEVSENN
jgi:Uma2 family endonuclease